MACKSCKLSKLYLQCSQIVSVKMLDRGPIYTRILHYSKCSIHAIREQENSTFNSSSVKGFSRFSRKFLILQGFSEFTTKLSRGFEGQHNRLGLNTSSELWQVLCTLPTSGIGIEIAIHQIFAQALQALAHRLGQTLSRLLLVFTSHLHRVNINIRAPMGPNASRVLLQ